MSDSKKFNNLRDEESRYLKQHRENPVNWYPYGPEALQKAKDENKPVFLSIGYSSCHWCHIMAEESFESEETAKLLNDNFINIKVDREELPDLDNYYQLACQALNGRGGWPLNVFLTPQQKPFFIGTYFPKNKLEDVPSFNEVLSELIKSITTDSKNVEERAAQIVETIKKPPFYENKVDFEGHFPTAASVMNALKNFQDNDNGGYGTSPKFPQFAFYEWATEQILEGVIPEEFGKHVVKSIESILSGAIYDQARGGIHRYTVDDKWAVPHFEKMLYDQAGLLRLLAKIGLVYPSPLVFDALVQTLDYLKTEMLDEKGFFFSAQDAQSEGVEGLYFCFTEEEFDQALMNFSSELADQIDDIKKWFPIVKDGNFERRLNTIRLDPNYLSEHYKPESWEIVRKVRQALWEDRKMRIPPATDRKGIASWNFQLGSALLDVIQYCQIDSIKNGALDLLGKINKSLHDIFLYKNEDGKFSIATSTTRKGHYPLLEDFVMFAEFSFKNYELSSFENYLENGKSTIEFIMKEFFKDGVLFERSLNYSDHVPFDNISAPIFDQAYKSSIATLIGLVRKWSLHINEFKEYQESLTKTADVLTHLSLQNPLGFGETLRALTYPDEAYKKFEFPKKWMENAQFRPLLARFSSRFVFSYHTRDDEKWQLCGQTECELQGDGLEEFIKIFVSPEEEQSE